jgi:hypothetical protein
MNLRRAVPAALFAILALSACSKKPDDAIPAAAKSHPPPENWLNPVFKPPVPAAAPAPKPIPKPAVLGPDAYVRVKGPEEFSSIVLAQYPDTITDQQLKKWLLPRIEAIPDVFQRKELEEKKLPEVHKMRVEGQNIHAFALDSDLPKAISAIFGHYDAQRNAFETKFAPLQTYPEFTQQLATPTDEMTLPATNTIKDNFPSWWTPSSLELAKMIEAQVSKMPYDQKYAIRSYIQIVSVEPDRYVLTYQIVAMTLFDPISKQPMLTIGTP